MYSGSARVPIAAVAGKFGVAMHYTNAYILHTDLVGEEKKEEKGKIFFSPHCNTPALASSHMHELADLAVLFGFKVDIDELPELMKDVGAGQCGQ